MDDVKRGIHVIAIDEREEAFRGGHEAGKLEVVRPKNCPTSEHKAYIHDPSTDKKPDHLGSSSFYCHEQAIAGFEETKKAEYANPN